MARNKQSLLGRSFAGLFVTLMVIMLSACAGKVELPETLYKPATPKDQNASSPEQKNENEPASKNTTQRSTLEAEKTALLQQPYIDPITSYLEKHQDDSARDSVIRELKDERERRCSVVAREYAEEPATREVLEKYRAGYEYSCPQQVAAFQERVRKVQQENRTVTRTLSDTQKECYLLTSIKNYSAAREVCTSLANNGDQRAIESMAKIEFAYENFALAAEWALKVSDSSADASYLLGRMYRDGQGVEADLNTAQQFFQRAASQGHEEAQQQLTDS